MEVHGFSGYVRDTGGGIVTIVIDRDTDSYPPDGAKVLVTYLQSKKDEED